MRGVGWAERPSGVPDHLNGRIQRGSSGADAAGAHPCYGRADKRARTSTGQMVQSASRLRFLNPRGGHARHFRAHGNAPTLRHGGIAPRPVRLGALWPWSQRPDGRRGPAGERLARPGIALALGGFLLRIALNGKSSLARSSLAKSSLATALLVAS